VRAPTRPAPASITKLKRRPGATRPVRRADDAKPAKHGPADAKPTTPPTAPTGEPAAEPAPPAARPPANVEWKPTLLLPTDGSGTKAPR
jgi:hypothetical protein